MLRASRPRRAELARGPRPPLEATPRKSPMRRRGVLDLSRFERERDGSGDGEGDKDPEQHPGARREPPRRNPP